MMNCKTKVCPACGNEFEPYHGNQKYCLECAAEAKRESVRKAARRYYWANRERIMEYHRGYYKANREKILECRRANREKVAESWRKYYERNRERILERQREYRRANREKLLEYDRWYKNGGNVEIMMRKKAEEAKKALEPDEFGKDWRETSKLADEKPETCKFEGPCVECPYPDCVES